MITALYILAYICIGVFLLILVEKWSPSTSPDENSYFGYVIVWPFWLLIAIFYAFNQVLIWIVKKVNGYD